MNTIYMRKQKTELKMPLKIMTISCEHKFLLSHPILLYKDNKSLCVTKKIKLTVETGKDFADVSSVVEMHKNGVLELTL